MSAAHSQQSCVEDMRDNKYGQMIENGYLAALCEMSWLVVSQKARCPDSTHQSKGSTRGQPINSPVAHIRDLSECGACLTYLASTAATETLGMVSLLVAVGGGGVRNAYEGFDRRYHASRDNILIWIAAWGWLTVVLLVGSIVCLACEGGEDEEVGQWSRLNTFGWWPHRAHV